MDQINKCKEVRILRLVAEITVCGVDYYLLVVGLKNVTMRARLLWFCKDADFPPDLVSFVHVDETSEVS